MDDHAWVSTLTPFRPFQDPWVKSTMRLTRAVEFNHRVILLLIATGPHDGRSFRR